MKSTKWKKWRISKYKFPTYEIQGDRKHNRPGANMIGRIKATAHLAETLGRERVDKMVVSDTRTEWVFKENCCEVEEGESDDPKPPTAAELESMGQQRLI